MVKQPELKITEVEIDGLAITHHPPHHHARVRFRYGLSGATGTMTANLLCTSTLPADAQPERLRADLVKHGLGQLRRMPEIWLGRARISMALTPDDHGTPAA
ncbi:hypothetical protein [Oceaniglobus indicus]|uniref:hypothetical protein n=1 Tax=Oceaniglobus indicus TaxID=2047749 RepID=UPI000C19FE57|nr:hypothetical protein [Oceaniglobus indicus]